MNFLFQIGTTVINSNLLITNNAFNCFPIFKYDFLPENEAKYLLKIGKIQLLYVC